MPTIDTNAVDYQLKRVYRKKVTKRDARRDLLGRDLLRDFAKNTGNRKAVNFFRKGD